MFQFVGTGLVLPFHVIYLHEVRDFPLDDVGLLLGISPLVGLPRRRPRRRGDRPDRCAPARWRSAVALFILGDVAMTLATTERVAAVALVLSGAAFGLSCARDPVDRSR